MGKANITLTDATLLMDFDGDYFTKNGEKYMNVKSLKIKVTPAHTKFYFEEISNGDPALTQTINDLMNVHWVFLMNILFPEYEAGLGKRFHDIFNNIFHNTPIQLIFPE